MNELIEIKWTQKLIDDLERWIADRCQYAIGAPAHPALTTWDALQAEMRARLRTQDRAIAALREILCRHSRPAMDSEVIGAIESLRARVVKATPDRTHERDDEAIMIVVERRERRALNRTGEGS